MVLKAINNTTSLDRLVPTLLIFGTFLQVNIDLLPILLMLKHIKVIAKII
jgi:hypothetical protein